MDPETGLTNSHLSSITTIQNKFILKRLRKRYMTLETVMFEPQSIILEGCEYLRGIPGQHWASRIYGLFTDNFLPHVYILNMRTDDKFNTIPNKITIELISYNAKCYIFKTLLQFLTEHQKNNVKIAKN
jgi:hypothetical protein